MNDLLSLVLNYKKNRHNYSAKERYELKKRIRENIRVDIQAFRDAVDQINEL